MMVSSQQSQAVLAKNHTHVIAIPGSGKTRTIIAKTKHLLSQGETSVCIVTYTNASAKEVKERLVLECGNEALQKVTVATFHALMLRHLSEYLPQYTLFSPEERTALLHDVYLKHRGTHRGYEEFEEYSLLHQKNKDGEYEAILSDYYAALTEQKINTLDSVISGALEKMLSGELPLLPCRHLLVDEWQDADEQQLKLVLLHGRSGRVVTTVGDDDQSIYAFRKALGFRAFNAQATHLESQEMQLTVNYRSKQEILDAAFSLIGNNEERITKQPIAMRGEGGVVVHHCFSTRIHEARWVSEKIRCEPNIPTLVLARNRVNLQEIESELAQRDIPYKIRSNTRYYDVTCCKLFISALYSLSKNNKEGMQRLINVLFNDNQEHSSTRVTFENIVNPPPSELSAEQQAAFYGVRNAIEYFKQGQENQMLSTLAQSVQPELEKIGYQSTERIYQLASKLQKMTGSTARRLSLLSKEATQDDALVELMTIHSSKGLERERVFLMGFSRGVIPTERQTGGTSAYASIQEERRVAFVALTRAKDELYITSYRGTSGQPKRNGPSMFVKELGEIATYDH